MNKAGGRVKAQPTIMRKWFRQIPKNWQPRCAKTSASERRKPVRHNLRSVPMRRVTSRLGRIHRKSLTKALPDKDTHVERVLRPDVHRWYTW